MKNYIPPMVLNSDEEDAAINRGIASDPDTYELTEEFFSNARPASEMLPPQLYQAILARNKLRRHDAA